MLPNKYAHLISDMLGDELADLLGSESSSSTQEAARHVISQCIDELEQRGDIPYHYVRFEVVGSQDTFQIYIGRNLSRYPLTPEEYRDSVGVYPKQDELERVNCSEAGKPGHLRCGWCMQCHAPRMTCPCYSMTLSWDGHGSTHHRLPN